MGIQLNLEDIETVHQRCVLVTGTAGLDNQGQSEARPSEYVSVKITDEHEVIFPEQTWPLSHGHFKALLILTPGINKIAFKACYGGDIATAQEWKSVTLSYVPVLNKPPLHLAILVARDSPLQVDCPAAKYGDITSAHTSLDSVIAKFRMTAYMWQALTAEDLRSKCLGRRAFRLEEEWAVDTLSQQYNHAQHESTLQTAMQSTAKVHLIHTDHTVAQLRDAQLAQQNSHASKPNQLHEIFTRALKRHGGVFTASAHPVVAGLILDSHYSLDQNMILGHAALGAHNPNGLSLGIFGSHLTYSWPRYVEEISQCLLDARPPGEMVGNDNGECHTMWQSCAIGQGAFLHEVGHAFSAPHTSGIMQRGYARDWPKVFLSRTAQGALVTSETSNECTWDIRDALRFANLEHFRLPGDKPFVPESTRSGATTIVVDDEDFQRLTVSSASGIGLIYLNGALEANTSISKGILLSATYTYTLDEFEARFDRTQPLNMEILCMNGKHSTFDVWKLFSDRDYIRVPGASFHLQKQSVDATRSDRATEEWKWTVMLKKRGRNGELTSARKIDLRVGCLLDGAIVYYRDGSHVPCGRRSSFNGEEVRMGGHQARKLALPSSAEIVKVQVSKAHDSLYGLRMHLSNGKAMGALNKQPGTTVHDLLPPEGHNIVGFYGTSDYLCNEFGIISAPRDAKIPDSMWDMPELGNPEKSRGKNPSQNSSMTLSGDGDDDDEVISEDEDEGYDYDYDYDDDDDDDDVEEKTVEGRVQHITGS